jgi:hypothetical protein
MKTVKNYRWLERAKHIFEITDTGTHYDWFERAKYIFEIINTGTHYPRYLLFQTSDNVSRYSLFQIYA